MNRSKLLVVAILSLACALCIAPLVAHADSPSAGDATQGSAPQTVTAGSLPSNDAAAPAEGNAASSSEAAPANTTTAKAKKKVKAPKLKYKVYVKGKGWSKKWTKAGKKAGIVNKRKAIEGLRVSFDNGGREGELQYQAYIVGKGWTQDWTAVTKDAKRIGKKKGIADLKLRLTDDLAKRYEVLYRVHIIGSGWQPWLVGPVEAGSIDRTERIDGMRIKLIRATSKSKTLKKARANSKKYQKLHKKFDNRLDHAYDIAADMTSATDYLITVDLTNHWLCVFEDYEDGWEMIEDWQVSTGRPGSPTITGSYTVGDKGYSFGHGYTCYYYTQIMDDYLFHSVLYHEGTFKIKDGRLGKSISAGCVRMPLARAKWIYNNIPSGSRIYIYK